MGFPTKVQLIKRPGNQQWYINLPSALANAIGLQKGETVEWELNSREILVLVRKESKPPRELDQQEDIMAIQEDIKANEEEKPTSKKRRKSNG
jgi:antitoxin component of MazEF toxin-antitoxin module